MWTPPPSSWKMESAFTIFPFPISQILKLLSNIDLAVPIIPLITHCNPSYYNYTTLHFHFHSHLFHLSLSLSLSLMAVVSLLLSFFLPILLSISPALSTNSEGNALSALRSRLSDPTNVLQSWDPTLVNPCTWFHVTCDSNNHVLRLDLGNSNISGSLGPELGELKHLQYL